MKLSCKVIEDMLPMYYDGICSKESVELIEEHLKDCHHCSHLLAELRTDMSIAEKSVDDMKPLKKIQKSYMKMKLQWLIAVVAILLLIPLAFFAGNEHGEQSTPIEEYSEEEALACADAFMSALTESDYARAFSYWNIEAKKHEWLRNGDFKKEYLVDLEEYGKKKFCEQGEKIEALGGIEGFEFVKISENGYDYGGNKEYSVTYQVRFDGKDETFWVDITENGIYNIGAADGLLTHPLSQLCLWGHWLYIDYLDRYCE